MQQLKVKKREPKGPEEQSETTAEAQLGSKHEMLAQHGQLQTYARNFDPGAGPVKIRLEQAQQAAAEGDEKKFSTLAFSIWETLEEQMQRVSAARAQLPAFSSLKSPAFMKNAGPKPRGSREEKRADEEDITRFSQGSLEL